MALQRVNVTRPELSEGCKPRVQFLQRFGAQSVQPTLRVNARFHKSGVAQYAQVFGNGRLGQVQFALEVADRTFRCEEHAEDGASVGFGDNGKSGFHSRYITLRVYVSQLVWSVFISTVRFMEMPMTLSVKDAETVLLARALADATGETIPDAILRAIKEPLARVTRQRTRYLLVSAVKHVQD